LLLDGRFRVVFMIDPSSPLTQQIFLPPGSAPGVSFRLANPHDLRAIQENCYPEIDWWQFQHHYEYLLKWQENGRCYILVAEIAHSYVNRFGKSIRDDSAMLITGLPNLGRAQSNHRATVIGSGQLIFQADTAEIAELSVHPTYRNQGIGTAIIHILTQIAQERKTSILEIGADIDNEAALRLYRRLGFGRDRYLRLPNAQEAIVLKKYLAQRRGGAEDIL
jgi:ribosomal protein S18 acetylase RimI-like enzyme